jgi:chromosome segregation ATPase
MSNNAPPSPLEKRVELLENATLTLIHKQDKLTVEMNNQFAGLRAEFSETKQTQNIMLDMLRDTNGRLNQLETEVGQHTILLNQLETEVGQHTILLNQLETEVGQHTILLNQLETGVSQHTTLLNQLETAISQHTILLTQILERLPNP